MSVNLTGESFPNVQENQIITLYTLNISQFHSHTLTLPPPSSTQQQHMKSFLCSESLTSSSEASQRKLSFFLKVYLLIYLERDRERVSRGGAEGEGDRIPNRFCIVSAEPYVGLGLTNHEIMT